MHQRMTGSSEFVYFVFMYAYFGYNQKYVFMYIILYIQWNPSPRYPITPFYCGRFVKDPSIIAVVHFFMEIQPGDNILCIIIMNSLCIRWSPICQSQTQRKHQMVVLIHIFVSTAWSISTPTLYSSIYSYNRYAALHE